MKTCKTKKQFLKKHLDFVQGDDSPNACHEHSTHYRLGFKKLMFFDPDYVKDAKLKQLKEDHNNFIDDFIKELKNFKVK